MRSRKTEQNRKKTVYYPTNNPTINDDLYLNLSNGYWHLHIKLLTAQLKKNKNIKQYHRSVDLLLFGC